MTKQLFIFAFLVLVLPAVQADAQLSQQAFVKASNPGFLDRFGTKAAISGNTMVVTSIGEDSIATGVNGDQLNNGSNGAGAAYVFVRDANGTWTQQAYLKASNTPQFTPTPPEGDNFGFSCAIDGDTIVIGARWEDSNARGVNGDQSNNDSFNFGAAYVFVREGTTWTQQAYLKQSNTPLMDDGINNGDSFGISVAVEGDTIVVGAPFEDSNVRGVISDPLDPAQFNDSVPNSGAAYVFVRNGTTWSQQALLKQSNTELTDALGSNDGFGISVTVSGDTIVVGAPGEDSNSTGINGEEFNNDAIGSGAAYVFSRSGTIWSQQAYIKAEVTEAGDNFGSVVALQGNTLAVSVPAEDSNAVGVDGDPFNNASRNSGAVYIF